MKSRKLIAALLAVLMVGSLIFAALPAMGATTPGVTTPNAYTALLGSTFDPNPFKFYERLYLQNEETEVPDLTYKFEVVDGSLQKIDGEGEGTRLGAAGNPTVTASVTFTPSDAKTDLGTGGEYERYYVEKDVDINFSAVSFTEPGVYRWTVRKTMVYSGTDGVPTNCTDATGDDSANEHGLFDVYVTIADASTEAYTEVPDDPDAAPIEHPAEYKLKQETIVVTNHIYESNDWAQNANDPYDKDYVKNKLTDSVKIDYIKDKFPCNNFSLEFGKEVTGDGASRDKYFKFQLELTGLTPWKPYTIDQTLSKYVKTPAQNDATVYTAEQMATNNVTELTADEDGKVTWILFLQDGQYVRINGLPKGTGYTVTEDKEDYTQSEGTDAPVATDADAVHLNAVITDANDKVDALDTAITTVNTALENRTAAITTAEATVTTEEGTLTTKEGELTTAKNTLTAAQAELETAESQYNTAKQAVDDKEAEKAAKEAAIAAKQAEINTLDEEIAALEAEIDAIDAAIAGDLAGYKTYLAAAIAAKEAAIAAKEAEIALRTAQGADASVLTGLNNELVDLNDELDDLTDALDAANNDGTTPDSTALNTKKTNKETGKENKVADRAAAVSDLSVLNTELGTLNTDLGTLQTTLGQKETALSNAKRAVTNAQNAVVTAQNAVLTQQYKVELARSVLEALKSEKIDLLAFKASLEDTRAQLLDLIARSTEKLNKLNNSAKVHDDPTTGTIEDKSIYTGFTNNKERTAPTGIFMQIGAPIVGIVLVGALFAVMMISKRRREQEEAYETEE